MNSRRLIPRVDALGLLLLLLLAVGCGRAREYPRRPITMVVPWAAGGGTDRVARQMAAHLEQELKVPVNVVNATGGKGVTGHNRGLRARPDGYTLLMATLELNMLHWSGLTELTHDDCIPLMSLNEDYAALLVRKDAPWGTLGELERAIAEHPGTLKSSGTASGGAWHLALAGWLMEAGFDVDDVVWISSTGANPSLQELISGGVDMVCCSLPEAEALYAAGEVRPIGVMAPQPAAGYEQVPTFLSQGRDWSLGGWRALVLPEGTPDAVVERLMTALQRIVTGETVIVTGGSAADSATTEQSFPEFMDAAGFDRTYRKGQELSHFLDETDDKLGKLLTSEAMQSVNRDRYDSMAWPRVLMGLIAVTLLALGITHASARRRTEGANFSDEVAKDEEAGSLREQLSGRGILNFLLIVVGVAAYCLAVEFVGFFVAAGALLFLLLMCLRTRVWVSVLVTVVTVPLLWELFAVVLRVPLPRGEWVIVSPQTPGVSIATGRWCTNRRGNGSFAVTPIETPGVSASATRENHSRGEWG